MTGKSCHTTWFFFARRGMCMSTGFGNVVVTPNFFRRSAWLGAILASFTTSGWLGGSLNAAFASFFMVGIDKQAQALSFKSSSTRKLGPNLLCILKLSIWLFYLFFLGPSSRPSTRLAAANRWCEPPRLRHTRLTAASIGESKMHWRTLPP